MSVASVAEQWSEHFLSTPFERLPADNEGLLGDALGPALTRSMLYGRAKSIWGGSNEIQHNVIAKQVLGL